MRNLLWAMLALAVLFCAGGCFTRDTIHNREHWRVFEEDLDDAHADLDWIFFNRVEAPH